MLRLGECALAVGDYGGGLALKGVAVCAGDGREKRKLYRPPPTQY